MSTTTSPVTHTAEAAVNRAVVTDADSTPDVDHGSINSPAPSSTAPANDSEIARAARSRDERRTTHLPTQIR